jgi:hypothetical protein
MAKKEKKRLPTFKTIKDAFGALGSGKLPKKTQLTLNGYRFSLEVPLPPTEDEFGGKFEHEPHVFYDGDVNDQLVPYLIKRTSFKVKVNK